MEKSARRRRKQGARDRVRRTLDEAASVRIGRANVLIFGSALLAITLGFVTLALGSTSISAVLLVAGYLVLVPWSILASGGGSDKSPDSPS